MAERAVFLDRDGTLNVDTGYLGDPDKLELLPFVPEGLKILSDKFNFKLIVISNQSGITRGLITPAQVDAVNKKLNALLKPFSTKIDAFYYCPYHPDFDTVEDCFCRKPSPSLVFQAAEEWNIDLKKSFFVGDKISDVECGNNAGVKTVLLKTNSTLNKINKLKNNIKSPTFVAGDFREVCDFIIEDISEESV